MAAGGSGDSGAVPIVSIVAREIYDSRGNPTVEVDLETKHGKFRAAVPSGASTGIYEAIELRDGGSKHHGKGVEKAVGNVRDIIAPALIGKDVRDQRGLDTFMVQELDGSKNEWGWNKAKLGANAILAVSLAICKAGAAAKGMPLYAYIASLAGNEELVLPVPAANIINGGKHAGNALAPQEFMILPTGASSFREAMQMVSEVYHHLKAIIKDRYGRDSVNVGDEGGFAPPIDSFEEAIDVIQLAIEKAGYTGKIELGMDVAASEFFGKEGDAEYYDLKFKDEDAGKTGRKTGEELAKVYQDLVDKYPICTIEDPFDQDDFDSYGKMTALMGDKVQIVGDDLLVTNPVRVQKAIDSTACNALLLKVNQIGSVTESIDAVAMSKSAGWGVMTSHRSGETEDTFIADLAVGLSTGQIKTGAPCRSERTAKYNQLLRIEEELLLAEKTGGPKVKYAGKEFRKPAAPFKK